MAHCTDVRVAGYHADRVGYTLSLGSRAGVSGRKSEEAGKLAAYYSKNRGSEKIEIDYIEKKHVKKPKGGKPGFVVYYTNYSLMIDSDISQIKQLED